MFGRVVVGYIHRMQAHPKDCAGSWVAVLWAISIGRTCNKGQAKGRQFGVVCVGVLRTASEDPETLPRRVRKVLKEVRDGVRVGKEVDRSDNHIREGQADDKRKMENDRLDVRYRR